MCHKKLLLGIWNVLEPHSVGTYYYEYVPYGTGTRVLYLPNTALVYGIVGNAVAKMFGTQHWEAAYI